MADPEHRLHLVRGCGGSCNQGRAACDCELAADLGPDAYRVIQAPPVTPEDTAAIARIRRWTLVAIAAAFALLGALLGIADARFTP